MNKFFLVFVVVAMLFVGCFDWLQPPEPPVEPPEEPPEEEPPVEPPVEVEVITIGAMSHEQSIQNAINLAVEEINADGGVNGKTLEVVHEDTQCASTENAMQKLISENDLQAIISGLCSDVLITIRTNEGNYVFRMIPSYTIQSEQLAQLAYELEYTEIAILHVNNDYGLTLADIFEEEFESLGGNVVTREVFDETASNIRPNLLKIKAGGADAMLIASDVANPGAAGVKQAKDMDIEVQIFASETLYDESVLDTADDAAEGMLVTYLPSPKEDFVNNYQAKYDEEPGRFAAEAYDTVYAITKAMEQGGETGERMKNVLYSIEFEGASGTVDFDENGDITKAYAIAQVTDGEFVPYE